MADARRQLRAAVADTPLAERFERWSEPFFAQRGEDPVLREELAPASARGLARLLASHPDCARYLAVRPQLLQRIAHAPDDALPARALALARLTRPAAGGDLEEFLNRLRLFQRDETWYCAALDLGDSASFAQASECLSRIAETCLRWALAEAASRVPGALPGELSVVGMGKISGRELTYHSDLDLVFLYPDACDSPLPAVALAQRVISYLGTMTESGRAYSVDARLRPSGRQGTLVSACSAFESYQLEKAAAWEHLALMRSRVLTGDLRARVALARTRRGVLAARRPVWREVAEMRERVVAERARPAPGVLHYKTGPGGLMELEFLAQAGALERGTSPAGSRPPSTARLLQSAAPAAAPALLEHYELLRTLEARSRWITGRAAESFATQGEAAAAIAELVAPGEPLAALLTRLDTARGAIHSAYERVLAAGSIGALA